MPELNTNPTDQSLYETVELDAPFTATKSATDLLVHWLVFSAIAFALTFGFNHLPDIKGLDIDLKSILCGFGPLLSGLACYRFFATPNKHHISFSGVKPVLTYGLVALAVFLPLMLTARHSKPVFAAFILSQVAYSLGEEFGWRHYLQNEAASLNKGIATLLIGATWFFWHYAFIGDPIHALTGQTIPALIGVPVCIAFLSLFSLLLGDLVIKTKSILVPTVVHAVTKFADPVSLGVLLALLILLQVFWNKLRLGGKAE